MSPANQNKTPPDSGEGEKIWARVSATTLKSLPAGWSWGRWIETLARRRGRRGVVAANVVQIETCRMAIWCAANLDRIAKRVTDAARSRKAPGALDPVTGTQAAEILAELAQIRLALERMFHR
jgi:hypothetical protein